MESSSKRSLSKSKLLKKVVSGDTVPSNEPNQFFPLSKSIASSEDYDVLTPNTSSQGNTKKIKDNMRSKSQAKFDLNSVGKIGIRKASDNNPLSTYSGVKNSNKNMISEGSHPSGNSIYQLYDEFKKKKALQEV